MWFTRNAFYTTVFHIQCIVFDADLLGSLQMSLPATNNLSESSPHFLIELKHHFWVEPLRKPCHRSEEEMPALKTREIPTSKPKANHHQYRLQNVFLFSQVCSNCPVSRPSNLPVSKTCCMVARPW